MKTRHIAKDRRPELLKGVPTSTPTLLDVDLDRTDPTWPHVDLDPRRPDMYYYLQQLSTTLFSSFTNHIQSGPAVSSDNLKSRISSS